MYVPHTGMCMCMCMCMCVHTHMRTCVFFLFPSKKKMRPHARKKREKSQQIPSHAIKFLLKTQLATAEN